MPNRIIPEFWLYETSISNLRRNAQLFFFRLGLALDDYWRCFVGPSPQDPLFLRSTVYPTDPDVRVSDVARWLQECQSAGTLLVRDSDRGWFVEVPEHLRYRREDYQEGQPKYGPRMPKPQTQSDLPLGPVAIIKTDAPSRRRGAPTQVKRKRNQNDVESESPRQDAPTSPSDHTTGKPEGTRATGRREGDSDNRFARGDDDLPDDELWQDLCRVLGPLEMVRCGALWETRLKIGRSALRTALQDFLTKPPEERAKYNAAAYITAAYEAEIKRAS